MTYYIISSDYIEERPYLRVVYDLNEGSVVMSGYSHMKDYKDASIFDTEEEARKVMRENNPNKENLKLQRVEIIIDALPD